MPLTESPPPLDTRQLVEHLQHLLDHYRDTRPDEHRLRTHLALALVRAAVDLAERDIPQSLYVDGEP